MTLPNLLTLSRILLAAVLVACIFSVNTVWNLASAPVFLLASLTDYWDGALARKRNQLSLFGALMDPIADKVLTSAAFISFWFLGLIPGLCLAAVLVRDASVTLLRLGRLRSGEPIAARSSGKQKTVLQMVYITMVLLYTSLSPQTFWNAGWTAPTKSLIVAGMVWIVLITLWSGFSAVLSVAPVSGRQKA